MRSMHAEMRALAVAAGFKDHADHGHPRGRWACMQGENAASEIPYTSDWLLARGCPACVIARHAQATRVPQAPVPLSDGTIQTHAEHINAIIRRAGYPLPLIPEPRRKAAADG